MPREESGQQSLSTLTVYPMGNFHAFVVFAIFFQNQLFKHILSGTLSEFHTLSVSPDLDPNCLQRLSTDDESQQMTTKA